MNSFFWKRLVIFIVENDLFLNKTCIFAWRNYELGSGTIPIDFSVIVVFQKKIIVAF